MISTGVRAVIGIAGIVAIGYGLFLAWTTITRLGDLVAIALWFGLPPVIFDLLLVPLFGLIGLGVAAIRDHRWRAPLVVGLIISAALLAVGLPFIAGIGQRPDNPSVLDRPYLLGTVIALAVVWAGIGGWGLFRRLRTVKKGKR